VETVVGGLPWERGGSGRGPWTDRFGGSRGAPTDPESVSESLFNRYARWAMVNTSGGSALR
jgi:hypothetical protein